METERQGTEVSTPGAMKRRDWVIGIVVLVSCLGIGWLIPARPRQPTGPHTISGVVSYDHWLTTRLSIAAGSRDPSGKWSITAVSGTARPAGVEVQINLRPASYSLSERVQRSEWPDTSNWTTENH